MQKNFLYSLVGIFVLVGILSCCNGGSSDSGGNSNTGGSSKYFAYVANYTSATVTAYQINSFSGGLSISAGTGPVSVVTVKR